MPLSFFGRDDADANGQHDHTPARACDGILTEALADPQDPH